MSAHAGSLWVSLCSLRFYCQLALKSASEYDQPSAAYLSCCCCYAVYSKLYGQASYANYLTTLLFTAVAVGVLVRRPFALLLSAALHHIPR